MLRNVLRCALALAALGCGGSEPAAPPPRHPGMCFMPRARTAFAQPIRAHDWLRLLVQLDLGHGGVFVGRDCTGRKPFWQGPSRCAAAEETNEQPEPVPIGREALITRSLGGDAHLVWIVSHRFANGDGFGPLALARRVADGVEVDALGSLRMRPERVSLELWHIQGEAVVVASGETCGASGDHARCQRSVRLLLQRGRTFQEAPVLTPEGACMQDGAFELSQRRQQQLSSGLRRSYELSRQISHDARYIVVEERLLVRDTDPSAPNLPARELQHIEANRFIHAAQGRLVSAQRSLWDRVASRVDERGSPGG